MVQRHMNCEFAADFGISHVVAILDHGDQVRFCYFGLLHVVANRPFMPYDSTLQVDDQPELLNWIQDRHPVEQGR